MNNLSIKLLFSVVSAIIFVHIPLSDALADDGPARTEYTCKIRGSSLPEISGTVELREITAVKPSKTRKYYYATYISDSETKPFMTLGTIALKKRNERQNRICYYGYTIVDEFGRYGEHFSETLFAKDLESNPECMLVAEDGQQLHYAGALAHSPNPERTPTTSFSCITKTYLPDFPERKYRPRPKKRKK